MCFVIVKTCVVIVSHNQKDKTMTNRTKVWVLLHTIGYAHDDVSVVAVYTSKEAAESAHRNHTEPGNCIVEESYLER